MEHTKNMCKCCHHKVFPILVILFGSAFLLEALGITTPQFTMIAWPTIIVVAGVTKLTVKMCKCC